MAQHSTHWRWHPVSDWVPVPSVQTEARRPAPQATLIYQGHLAQTGACKEGNTREQVDARKYVVTLCEITLSAGM